MTLVSVIIPIYNTEKYLKQCLNSVLEQTLTDIEIICINDGSEDNSLNILKEYSQKDKRVKVINLKTNKGVSYSRNIGIQESKSPYIFFLDSDDWIEPNCLEELYNKIVSSNTEITICSYNYYRNGTKIGDQLIDLEKIKEKKDIFSFRIIGSIGGKLFSRDFIEKNFILFNEDLITSEDTVFNFMCLSYGASISVVIKNLYNYNTLREYSACSLVYQQDSEIEALIYFIEQGFYNKLSDFYKKVYTTLVIQNALNWYKLYKSKSLKKQIQKIYRYLIKNISIEILKQSPNFEEFKNIALTLWQKIVSINSWKKFVKQKLLKL